VKKRPKRGGRRTQTDQVSAPFLSLITVEEKKKRKGRQTAEVWSEEKEKARLTARIFFVFSRGEQKEGHGAPGSVPACLERGGRERATTKSTAALDVTFSTRPDKGRGGKRTPKKEAAEKRGRAAGPLRNPPREKRRGGR